VVWEAWVERHKSRKRVDTVANKLNICRHALTQWSKKFGFLAKLLEQKMAQLQKLQHNEGPHNQGWIK
jgi:hypothetical protein